MSMTGQNNTNNEHIYDVLVIGMGAAGVGVSLALRSAGIQNFLGLERRRVGSSFDFWPSEMRFITPSFPTNSIGMLDLNSIAIGVSPAFGLKVEHPSGKQYASHLRGVAKHFKLPIREKIEVRDVVQSGGLFYVDTRAGELVAKHIIWAAGEFQYPNMTVFPGSENCMHIALISKYEDLQGDDFIVVGGYESGVDIAYNLARRGKRVRLFDQGFPWDSKTSDPSASLSAYSLERMRSDLFIEYVELFPYTSVESVNRTDATYEVIAQDGQRFKTSTQPILASGFAGSHKLVEHLFEQREDGFPLLNEHDESTIAPGLFLCGPAVRHGGQVFCFIYKYRQRFAVVAKAIATSLGLPAEDLETYRSWGMYLDDLSCCGEECVC